MCKRVSLLVLVCLLSMNLALAKSAVKTSVKKAPTKKIVAKSNRVADESNISSAVLRATHFTGEYKYDGGVAKTKAKFEPSRFADGWALAHYDESSNVPGIEWIPYQHSYLLKKTGGKWRAVFVCGGDMMLKDCKKIGISPSTVRKLHLFVNTSNKTDDFTGYPLH